jgi:hypothetical protein
MVEEEIVLILLIIFRYVNPILTETEREVPKVVHFLFRQRRWAINCVGAIELYIALSIYE